MFFLFNYRPYIVLIGDIKNSKKISNRAEVQRKFNNVLECINMKYFDSIASKFMITLGDEFQGVLCKGENLIYIISEIEREMFPIKIRFGVGIGEITTEINIEKSIGADGPGYYKARQAIEYLKENEKKKKSSTANIRFEVDCKEQSSTIMINTIVSLSAAIRDSWSNRQREIIWDMLEHQDNQVEVAKRLGITQPTVQKALSKSKYYVYKEAMDTIERAVKEI